MDRCPFCGTPIAVQTAEGVRVWSCPTGDFMHADAGVLDLGIVRASVLADPMTFTEFLAPEH